MALRFLPPFFLVSCALFALNNSVSAAPPDKVNVSLYYQSLCYGCSDFMTNYLPEIFDNGLIGIVNLHLAPYGNARVDDKDGKLICQNGPDECLLNAVQACAIYTWPDLNQHYPFLKCIAAQVVNGSYAQWKTCYQQTSLPSQSIDACINGELGDKLIQEYGKETPPHEYVPWLVVNKQPLYKQILDFMKFICNAYKGTPKPTGCNGLPPPLPVDRVYSVQPPRSTIGH